MSSTHQEHSNWTAAGADTAAQNTYTSIKTALREVARNRNVEVFLQGSYANATNIRADSDVDVVVMTVSTFRGSTERLGAVARARYDALPAATITSTDLRQEVTAALVQYYGSGRVHSRNKCVLVDGVAGYVDADVVPCLQYHYYTSANANISTDYVSGILIRPQHGPEIINFPKEHIANGHAKNALCHGRYKATVRQLKHLRNRAVAEGRLGVNVAPGYLLECLAFNVTAPEFVADDSKRLSNVVLKLKFENKASYRSCDGIHTLFGTDPGNFDVPMAQTIIDALWDAY